MISISIANICYIVPDPDRLHWWILVRAKATMEKNGCMLLSHTYGSLLHRHYQDTSQSLERKPHTP